MNYEWQDTVWQNCNLQSNFPSALSLSVTLTYFYIKEKPALSTQKKSHSVDSLRFFIFSPSSLRFMWASLSSFGVFVFFSSWGQTGSPKTWASLPRRAVFPAPPLWVCPLYFLSQRFCLLFGCDWDSAERPGQDRCVGCGDARMPTVWQMLLRPASSASGGGVRPQKHTRQGNQRRWMEADQSPRSRGAQFIHPTLHFNAGAKRLPENLLLSTVNLYVRLRFKPVLQNMLQRGASTSITQNAT